MNFKVPELLNEEIKDYKKNSKERLEVEKTYDNLYNQNSKFHSILEMKRFTLNPEKKYFLHTTIRNLLAHFQFAMKSMFMKQLTTR